MFKIQILNNISEAGLQLFPSDSYNLNKEQNTPDAILLRSHNLHDLIPNSNLLALARAGAGVNNIPVAKLTEKGVPVFNTPGANANAVKELVVAGLLLASRNLYNGVAFTKQLTGDLDTQIETHKKQFIGAELPGKTLAVIGLGAIGVKVANIGAALGMEVIGYDPAITIQRAWELSSSITRAESIEQALAKADFVSIHIPGSNDNKNFLNTARIAKMKKGAVLLNFARKEIVEEEALIHALRNKHLDYYITDFPTALLQPLDNVIALPHLGASTYEAEENCAVMAVKELRNFLELGHIENSVNLPNVILEASGAEYRLSIVNQNIPNMLREITQPLAENQINIVDMVNRSRDSVAYTLLDLNQPANDNTLKQIANAPGIIKIRQFRLSK